MQQPAAPGRGHANVYDDSEDSDEIPDQRTPDTDSDLKLLEEIGKGAYGTVYRAIWQGQLIAAKVVEHDDSRTTANKGAVHYGIEDTMEGTTGGGDLNLSLMEGAMSLIMQHPNIVRSLGYHSVPKGAGTDGASHQIRLLMEFCDRGSLDKAVQKGCFHETVSGTVQVHIQHLLMTLMEIAYAMRHLHNMHILHRDLKISNVLLKSSNKDSRGFSVKVSDFGLARVHGVARPGDKTPFAKQYAGTVTHMAPELIERGEVSTACDVYAFGILMWECYTRLTPYKGLIQPQVLMGVVKSKLRPAFASQTPQGYKDLAMWCWAQNPKERPTFTQVAKCLCLLKEQEDTRLSL